MRHPDWRSETIFLDSRRNKTLRLDRVFIAAEDVFHFGLATG